MPKFTVMVNRTRTIESSVEFEVSSTDEETAQAKIEDRIVNSSDEQLAKLAWEDTSDESEYEYEASEA